MYGGRSNSKRCCHPRNEAAEVVTDVLVSLRVLGEEVVRELSDYPYSVALRAPWLMTSSCVWAVVWACLSSSTGLSLV